MESKCFSKEATMNPETKATIIAVINTLNNVEVHGKNNLDMVLGCILSLEKLCKDGEDDG